jgi:hypothetical protein
MRIRIVAVHKASLPVRRSGIFIMRRCGVKRFTSPGFLSFVTAILLVSIFAISLQAQTASVRLEGIVWDPSGEPIPGAALTAVEEKSGLQMETASDSEGYYRFLALPPGIYTVTAKSKEFKDVIHRNIVLFSPDTTIDNISFEVSAIDKEIPIQENPRINDSANTGSFFNKQIDSLPVVDRNPFSLFVYQPGVQISGGNEAASTVNGMRKATSNIRMDGMLITDLTTPGIESSWLTVNPDSLSDIQIVTLGAKAEYGGSAGAQFILATRRGTKSWTGSFYDYFRSRKLNAGEFFTNAANFPRPGLERNIFGASMSGPVGSKTRVFGNFEGNITDQQLIRNRLVLTSDAKTGVFQWYDPTDTTRDNTTVKKFDIPANDPRGIGIDPTIAAIIAKLPLPNNTYIGDGLNTGGYLFDNPVYNDQQRVTARIDRTLSNNHLLFFRFNYEHTNATDITNNADASFIGQPYGSYKNNSWALAVGSDWTISPTKVNELRIGYTRPDADLKRPARSTQPMFLANSWSNPLNPSFPRDLKTPTFEISDALSHSMKSHAFKYGVSFRRTVQNITNYDGVYPNVTFGRDHGNIPDSSIGPQEQVDSSTADRINFEYLYNDLLGRIESVSQTFNSNLTSVLPVGTPRKRDYASNEFSAFIQDDWKIRRNLTLNVGLRYDVFPSPRERNGFQAAMDKASRIGSTANISDFIVSRSDSWYSTDWKNFAPRFGFAWDITGSGNTVLRGSYGIFYDRLNGAITNFVDQNSYGFSQTINTYPNSGGTDVRLSDGIPLPAQPAALAAQPAATRSLSVSVLDPKLSTPRVDQFNLTLEKRLWGAVLEFGYSGTRGKKLFQYTNLNQTKTKGDFQQAFQELRNFRDEGTPVSANNTLVRIFGSPIGAIAALSGSSDRSNLDSGQMGAAADLLDLNYFSQYAAAGVSDFYIRNFPQFDKFVFGSNSASSWFDSFQIGLRKSTANYNFRAYYTLSKSLDTISSDGSSFFNPSDSFHPEFDKAPSDFDRARVLNIAWDYVLPYGRNRSSDTEYNKWIDRLLGGWNLGLLYVRESGQRFSVYSDLQTQFAGVSSLADFSDKRSIGSIYKNNGSIYWFNPDQVPLFTNPEMGENGTSGRNSFVGPGYSNLDAVLHKKFAFKETRSLQLRLEAFNVFNRTHFGNPDGNLFDSNFGTIHSTVGTPRALQVALRFQF